MKIFLDTNSLLSYFTEDSDISSIEALIQLAKEKKIKILYTEQLENEYTRNVGNRIEKTRSSIEKSKLEFAYKSADGDSDELKNTLTKKVKAAEKFFETSKKKRLTNYVKAAKKIDKLIEEIFSLGERVPYSDEIIKKAELRLLKGNPPKKKSDNTEKKDSSHGDAIHWESILQYAVDDNLVLITGDSDYLENSPSGQVLNRFLVREWKAKSRKTLTHYLGLGRFINTFEKKKVISEKTLRKEETPFVGQIFLENLKYDPQTGTFKSNPSYTFYNDISHFNTSKNHLDLFTGPYPGLYDPTIQTKNPYIISGTESLWHPSGTLSIRTNNLDLNNTIITNDIPSDLKEKDKKKDKIQKSSNRKKKNSS